MKNLYVCNTADFSVFTTRYAENVTHLFNVYRKSNHTLDLASLLTWVNEGRLSDVLNDFVNAHPKTVKLTLGKGSIVISVPDLDWERDPNAYEDFYGGTLGSILVYKDVAGDLHCSITVNDIEDSLGFVNGLIAHNHFNVIELMEVRRCVEGVDHCNARPIVTTLECLQEMLANDIEAGTDPLDHSDRRNQ
jgi:hypothetical protein